MNSAADPAAKARLDRQLGKLDRLEDLGLQIVEALAAQAKRTGPQVVEGDIALAYERVARAVRLSVMLQAQLVEGLRLAQSKPANPTQPSEPDPAAPRKDAIARVVGRVAQGDKRLNPSQIVSCRTLARQRLEHDDIYGLVMSRPVSDVVAAICKDLGLTPDWARLAEEAWAQDEIDSGRPGEPLQGLFDIAPDDDPAVVPPTFEGCAEELAAEAAAERRASG